MGILRRLALPARNSSSLLRKKRKHCQLSTEDDHNNITPISPPPPVNDVADHDTSCYSTDCNLVVASSDDGFSQEDGDDDDCFVGFEEDNRTEVVVTPPPRRGRRVRFAAGPEYCCDHFDDQDDDCRQSCSLCEQVDLDFLQDHKTELWYAKTDRKRSQTKANKAIANFKKKMPGLVSQYSNLYNKVLQSEHSEDISELVSLQKFQLPVAMRGLEWGITPLLVTRRKHHVAQTLRCCSYPRAHVAECAAISSRTARIMAQIRAFKALRHVFPVDNEREHNRDSADRAATAKHVVDEVKKGNTAANSSKMIRGLPLRLKPQPKRMRLWKG